MSEPQRFETSRMLAVILGASQYPKSPDLAGGKPFMRSARDMHDYLAAEDGLGLVWDNVKSLFDDPRSPADQLEELREFLTRRVGDQSSRPSGLLLFYVGHGLFARHDQAYCLAIRQTTAHNEGPTSLRTSDLAATIKSALPRVSKFLIMDCCFSAAVAKDFQSDVSMVATRKLSESFPERGTVILCSSSAHDVAFAPASLERTMFSDALTRVLRRGAPDCGRHLTFADVVDLVHEELGKSQRSYARPEIHVPEQQEGNLSRIPFFPNKSYRKQVHSPDPLIPDPIPVPPIPRKPVLQRPTPPPISPKPVSPKAVSPRPVPPKPVPPEPVNSRAEPRRRKRKYFYAIAILAAIVVVVSRWPGQQLPDPLPPRPLPSAGLMGMDARTVALGDSSRTRVQEIAAKAYRGDDSWRSDLGGIEAPIGVADDSESARALNESGLQHFRANDLDQAMKDFIEGNHDDIYDIEIINNLGYIAFRQGNYRVAEAALLSTLGLAPQHVNAWFNLGQTLAAIRQHQLAVGCFLVAYGVSDNKQRTLTVTSEQTTSNVPGLAEAAAEAVARINGQ